MSLQDKQISEEFLELASKANALHVVMSGKVISTDPGEMTAVVELNMDDSSAPTEGITLNVLLQNLEGFYGIPVEGASCLVGQVDGAGKWEILKCSEYESIYIVAGNRITLNDGSYEGLVKVIPLTEKINIVENDLNDLKSNLSGVLANLALTIAGGGGSTPVTVASLYALLNGSLLGYVGHVIEPTLQLDLENRKVIHG
jgi:hypothetical protein